MEIEQASPTSLNFRLWLQSKLMEKCKVNSRYSLRAFAAFLQMDPSSVSQLLSGKRKASNKVIRHVCDRLSATPRETNEFLVVAKRKKHIPQVPEYSLVTEDAFAYISNWYHYAILELTYVESFESDPSWIARTLGISVTEAKIALERLLRLGLLKEEDGVYKKTNQFITNIPKAGYSSNPQKELQRQILQKALLALDSVDPTDRDMTSMTMAIDVDRLPEAREVITKFRRELCALLENGEQTRVYNLGIQLYPVSEKHIGGNHEN